MKTQNLLVLLAVLMVLLVGMLSNTFGQERPVPVLQPSENFKATDIPDAGFAQEQQARIELQKKLDEEKRSHDLRSKVEKLLQTSYKLQQRLNNPFVLHADTSKLARECEDLVKEIKQLTGQDPK